MNDASFRMTAVEQIDRRFRVDKVNSRGGRASGFGHFRSFDCGA